MCALLWCTMLSLWLCLGVTARLSRFGGTADSTLHCSSTLSLRIVVWWLCRWSIFWWACFVCRQPWWSWWHSPQRLFLGATTCICCSICLHYRLVIGTWCSELTCQHQAWC